MMYRRIFGAMTAVALATGVAAAPGQPVPEDVDQIYDIFVGGLKIAEMTVEADIEGPSYSADARLQTSGLVARFFKASFEAHSEGTIAGGSYGPELFTAHSRDTRKQQFVELSYADGRPSGLRADPAFVPKPWEIDPLAQADASDPLSAALGVLANQPGDGLCNRTVEIFDGRKRYAIVLLEPEQRDAGIRCEALYRRVAGFKPKQMKDPEFPFEFWFEQAPNGTYRVLRALGDTPIGTAVIRRRRTGS